MLSGRALVAGLTLVLISLPAGALERPDVTFKVFQFPPSMAPRIDGNADDWKIVPDDYAIGMDQFVDTEQKHGANIDRKNLDVTVKVGWVKGQNRLYFLYEASDNYWDFSLPGLHNDIFEIVVDGDLSGGPLIDQYHRDVWRPEVVGVETAVLDQRFDREAAQRQTHGVTAQNYHIFTPPGPNKNWAMQWGCPQYGIDLPYAQHAYNYSFKPGEPGRLILEFYITPFDYAGCEGPWRALETQLTENKLIGLGLGVIDWDSADAKQRDGFWNISHKQLWFGHASLLVGFRLMPFEPQFQSTVEVKYPTGGEGFPAGAGRGGPGAAKPPAPSK
jgi:hypothetical protein